MEEESGQNELPPQQAEDQQRAEAQARKSTVPVEVREQRLAPKPSFWPIILAFTLAVTCIGVIIHPALFIFGIVLTIGAIVGWILEKK